MPEEGACAAAVKRTRGETKGPREACTKQGRNGTDCVGHRGTQEWAPFASTVVWRRGLSKKMGRAKPSHFYRVSGSRGHDGGRGEQLMRYRPSARAQGRASSPVWCQQARRPDTCLPDLLAGAGSRPGEARGTADTLREFGGDNHNKDFKRG